METQDKRVTVEDQTSRGHVMPYIHTVYYKGWACTRSKGTPQLQSVRSTAGLRRHASVIARLHGGLLLVAARLRAHPLAREDGSIWVVDVQTDQIPV